MRSEVTKRILERTPKEITEYVKQYAKLKTMKREIKFRGKRVDNGEWVYGGFHKVSDDIYIIIHKHFNNLAMNSEVIPETVGQFTGLKDKNGVDIYEGDVVVLNNKNHEIKYFNNFGMFGLVGKSAYSSFDENKPMGSGGSSTKYKPYVLSDYYQKRIQVIGNIHENKDNE